MKLEHTVINGAGRMEECAEHIRALFADEGYEAQKLRVDDPNVKAMVVQIRNTTSKTGTFLKTVTGLNACAKLKLQVEDDTNLHIEVVNGKWLDKTLVVAFGTFVALGILTVTGAIGLFKQKRLLDRVFMESISFFTEQN